MNHGEPDFITNLRERMTTRKDYATTVLFESSKMPTNLESNQGKTGISSDKYYFYRKISSIIFYSLYVFPHERANCFTQDQGRHKDEAREERLFLFVCQNLVLPIWEMKERVLFEILARCL